MTTFTVHEAKTHLSKLIEAVERGEEIVIARGKKPAARLVPYEKPKIVFGLWKDHGPVPPGIFDADPEDVELWSGREPDDAEQAAVEPDGSGDWR